MTFSLPWRIRLLCPRTLRGGRNTTAMSCYDFPTRTRLPSSRFRRAHSSEMLSVYERLCRNLHERLMAPAHLCGRRLGSGGFEDPERGRRWVPTPIRKGVRELICWAEKLESQYAYPPKPDLFAA